MKKNIEQEKAIAQLEGPVILISCPGSGKTTTLLRRINHMLEVGIPPGSPDTPISQEEVEEERRLFYVAVTRAKERLFITYVGNKKGKPVSRFVRELQLKESGRAKTVKKNDMVRHKTYGVCMVLSVNGNKCTIRSLSDDRDAEVLVSSLGIR